MKQLNKSSSGTAKKHTFLLCVVLCICYRFSVFVFDKAVESLNSSLINMYVSISSILNNMNRVHTDTLFTVTAPETVETNSFSRLEFDMRCGWATSGKWVEKNHCGTCECFGENTARREKCQIQRKIIDSALQSKWIEIFHFNSKPSG